MNIIKKLKTISKVIIAIVVFINVSTTLTYSQNNKDWIIDSDNNRKFDYFFYEALKAKAKGNYYEAFDFLQHCHSLDSTNSNVLSELAGFYNVLDNKQKAVEYLKKAVAKDSNNYYYNMMLASLSKDIDQKGEAIDIYKKLLKEYPQKTDIYMAMAETYNAMGELDKAIESLNKLEENVGIREAITLNKFRLYSLLNKKDKAFDEIKNIIKKNPDNLAYVLLLGDLYLQDEQYEESLKQYQKVKEIDSELPSLVISMVNYYEKTGNQEKAQEEIYNALINPIFEAEMKLQLLARYIALLQSSKLDTTKANHLFEALFDQHPHFSQFNFLFGTVLMMQENREEAMKQFEIYTQAEPDDPSGYEQLLRIALPDSIDKVVDITERAIKHIPSGYQFYFYLGASKYQQKKYKEALEIFEKGLEVIDESNTPMQSDFYGQIGDLNYALGNEVEAFTNYEKALKLNPQNLGVLNNYSYYLSLKSKDLDKAERMSGITVKAEPTNPTFLDTYGWVLFKQGAYVMSKIYIENAVKYSEEDISAEVIEHYGDVLFKTDDTEEAVKQWQKAKKLGGKSKVLDKKIKKKQYFE